MLIFYYGLLFLATLCISDDFATFLVLCLVDFLIGKAIWQDYEPFVSWRKKKYEQLITLKTWGSGLLLGQWEDASLLKKTYIIVAGVIGFALLILFFVLYSQIFLIPFGFSTIKEIGANFALAFLGTVTGGVALFSGFLAILRSETDERQSDSAESQAKTAEQVLINDRINKATENSFKNNENGEPVIAARINALYDLEDNAKDNIGYHIKIMEMLVLYIRTNAPMVNEKNEPKEPREDTRTALAIIGRRKTWSNSEERIKEEKKQGYRIDLRNRHLLGAQFTSANFKEAIFNGANLSRTQISKVNLNSASFDKADMSDARIDGTDMEEASFDDVNLMHAIIYDTNMKEIWLYGGNLSYAWITRTDLSNATINRGDMSNAHIRSVNMSAADITNVNMSGAQLVDTNMKNVTTKFAFANKGSFSECKNLTQKQIDQMFMSQDVVLPEGLIHPQKDSKYYKIYDTQDDFMEARNEWIKEQDKK